MNEKAWRDICDKMNSLNDMDWQEIIDKHDLGIARDTLRKAVTGTYGSFNISNELVKNKPNDDERIDELNEKIRELEIKKVQYQDERRVNSKYMRPLARHERLLEVVRNQIANLEPLEYDKASITNLYRKEASLLISDLHYGIKCDNYWNKYNTDIAKDRMFKLVSDTVRYCKQFGIHMLHVELLGDLISGFIHKTLELENEENVVKQTLECAELLSVCINELANEIPNVKVYMTVGNHSRITPNKKESVDTENFEYFIWEFLKLRNTRDDIEFVENDIDETLIHYEVNGESIFGVHGHLDKVSKIVQDFSTMFKGKVIKQIHAGHLHHSYMNEVNGVQVVMNSTASGTDTHSKNLRYVGNPSQTLIIYDGENTININIGM